MLFQTKFSAAGGQVTMVRLDRGCWGQVGPIVVLGRLTDRVLRVSFTWVDG